MLKSYSDPNNLFLRKTLYQGVFEYDTPLFHTGVCKYEFVSVEESEHDNPWKESFKQLYHGVHVRPGYQEKALKHPSRYKGKRIISTNQQKHFVRFNWLSPIFRSLHSLFRYYPVCARIFRRSREPAGVRPQRNVPGRVFNGWKQRQHYWMLFWQRGRERNHWKGHGIDRHIYGRRKIILLGLRYAQIQSGHLIFCSASQALLSWDRRKLLASHRSLYNSQHIRR